MIEVFNYHNTQLRIIEQDGEPWFVASDVAKILGYRMASDMTRRLDDEDRGTHSTRTPSGVQEMTIISEAGLYVAVLGSKVPGAREFKRWLTHEVLPSIRKHGLYATAQTVENLLSDPDNIIKILETIKEERAKRAELEAQRKADAPKVIFADAVSASKTSILVGDLAKILRGSGVEIGANRLFQQLRDNGYLIKRKGTDWNMPTQYSMELGLFEVKENDVSHSDGHVSISKTPKVTGKGQRYFVDKFLNDSVENGGLLPLGGEAEDSPVLKVVV